MLNLLAHIDFDRQVLAQKKDENIFNKFLNLSILSGILQTANSNPEFVQNL